MVRTYTPKKDPVTVNKVGKILSDLVSESKKDRKKVEDVYKLSIETYKALPFSPDMAKVVVDMLKVLQSSNDRTLKAAELMIKHLKEKGEMKTPKEAKATPKTFEELQRHRKNI